MKKIFKFLLVFAMATIFFACKKDDDPVVPNPNINFTATINGASEVPSNASTATGTATAVFNNDTKILTCSVTFTGVTATNAHIHKGAAGVSGGVIFPFTAPFTSPLNLTTATPLTQAQEDDLKANLYYVNIHSAAFPAGEIRGQLIKQ